MLYVTERCVFGLHEQGIELLEVAPGLDLERDILAGMAFRPVIEREPRLMDAALFANAPMGLRARVLMLPLADRFTYDPASRTMFINFERLSIRNADDVEAVRQEVEKRLAPLGHKVLGVVNYDHFALDPQVQDEWAAMVRELVDRHYIDVARYTTSGFLRAKLGPALAARGVNELYGLIHEIVNELMPAKNLYIALYDEATDLINFPYLVDELDKGWDASEDAIGFVAGLFQAAISINQRTPNIKVLISLRKELYDNIPALYEDAQKVRDIIEELEWDEERLQAACGRGGGQLEHGIGREPLEETGASVDVVRQERW